MKKLLCAFLLCAASVSYAGVDSGLAAYNKGDYQMAFKQLKPFAERGNANAQLYLGLMYVEGQGVPQDSKQAKYWWEKAAAQGNTKAQYNIGYMYAKGKGVPQNNATAIDWFKKSAELGNVGAQNHLAFMYLQVQAFPEALYWYRRTATQRDAMGQYNLGLMYAHGYGVPQDAKKAYILFSLAANGGELKAAKNRDIASEILSPTARIDAKRISAQLLASKSFFTDLHNLLNSPN